MRRNRGKLTWLSVLIVLGIGCSSVTTLQPLPRSSDLAERARFEGVWISDDDLIQVRFDKDGLGHFAGLGWDDEKFKLERGEMIVAAGKDLGFLSVRVEEDDGEWMHRYYLLQYRFTDSGDLVLWNPQPEPFADAVDAGTLEGTVERSDSGVDAVILGQPADLLAFIDDPEDLTLFDYRDPMIFKRIRAEDSK